MHASSEMPQFRANRIVPLLWLWGIPPWPVRGIVGGASTLADRGTTRCSGSPNGRIVNVHSLPWQPDRSLNSSVTRTPGPPTVLPRTERASIHGRVLGRSGQRPTSRGEPSKLVRPAAMPGSPCCMWESSVSSCRPTRRATSSDARTCEDWAGRACRDEGNWRK